MKFLKKVCGKIYITSILKALQKFMTQNIQFKLRGSYKVWPLSKFGKFETRTQSHVKCNPKSNGDINFHWKSQKTTESDLSQNVIILKNNRSQPVSSDYGCSLNLWNIMLSDDATFFIVLWLYYRYWNANLENIRYHKLLVSCEYYNYCHSEHHFRENVELIATKNSKDSKWIVIEEEQTKEILKTWKKILEKSGVSLYKNGWESFRENFTKEDFNNFKEIYEKMCGSFEESLRKSRENLGNCE